MQSLKCVLEDYSVRSDLRQYFFFFFSSRRRHTRFDCDWSSDVCSSDLRAREHTEHFVRENPVPAILGALGIGVAIGLAIRYASAGERKTEVEVKSPLGDRKSVV